MDIDELPPATEPETGPEPDLDTVVLIGGGASEAPIDPGPPTHVLWREDGSVEYVRPDGYETAELEPLPEDFDPETYTADPVTQTLTQDFTRFDAALHARIDEEAGEFRRRFITTVPGQEMTYLRKEAEARGWPGGSHPMITAEAAARDMTEEDLAAEVIANADAWAAQGAAVEAARLGAKKAVTEATTRAAKEAAAEVDWEALA